MTKINEMINTLTTIASSPKQQLEGFIAKEQKVIGCMPVYCPEELVYASGMIPFAVWGADVEVKEAKAYYPAFICSIVQTSLELGIRGSYKGLSGMMIPVLCDSLKCAGQNWKLAVKDIPFVPVIHPQNRKNDAGIAFMYAQYGKIKVQLELLSGNTITNETLTEAIVIYNTYRQTVRTFLEVANEYPLTINALTRSNLLKAAGFMDKKEYTKMLTELTTLLQAEEKEPCRGKKVVLSGILADNKDLLQILVDNHLQVVGDDLANQTRQIVTDIDLQADALMALSKAFAKMDGCSVLYDATKCRSTKITDYVKKTVADGVVIFMTKFCDPEEYDYPFIKRELDQNNIPNIMIEIDRQMQNYEQAKTALETFTQMI